LAERQCEQEMGAALVLAAPMAVAAAAAPPCVNVVGLQRSGTNLLEQMLGNCGVPACHPDGQRYTPKWKHFRITTQSHGHKVQLFGPSDSSHTGLPVCDAIQRAEVHTLEDLDELLVEAMQQAKSKLRVAPHGLLPPDKEDLGPPRDSVSATALEQAYVVMVREPARWAWSDAVFHERKEQLKQSVELQREYGCDWSLQFDAWLDLAQCSAEQVPCTTQVPLLGRHPRIALVRYDKDLLEQPETTAREVAVHLGLDVECMAEQGRKLGTGELDGSIPMTPGGGGFGNSTERSQSATVGELSSPQVSEVEGSVPTELWARVGYAPIEARA